MQPTAWSCTRATLPPRPFGDAYLPTTLSTPPGLTRPAAHQQRTPCSAHSSSPATAPLFSRSPTTSPQAVHPPTTIPEHWEDDLSSSRRHEDRISSAGSIGSWREEARQAAPPETTEPSPIDEKREREVLHRVESEAGWDSPVVVEMRMRSPTGGESSRTREKGAVRVADTTGVQPSTLIPPRAFPTSTSTPAAAFAFAAPPPGLVSTQRPTSSWASLLAPTTRTFPAPAPPPASVPAPAPPAPPPKLSINPARLSLQRPTAPRAPSPPRPTPSPIRASTAPMTSTRSKPLGGQQGAFRQAGGPAAFAPGAGGVPRTGREGGPGSGGGWGARGGGGAKVNGESAPRKEVPPHQRQEEATNTDSSTAPPPATAELKIPVRSTVHPSRQQRVPDAPSTSALPSSTSTAPPTLRLTTTSSTRAPPPPPTTAPVISPWSEYQPNEPAPVPVAKGWGTGRSEFSASRKFAPPPVVVRGYDAAPLPSQQQGMRTSAPVHQTQPATQRSQPAPARRWTATATSSGVQSAAASTAAAATSIHAPPPPASTSAEPKPAPPPPSSTSTSIHAPPPSSSSAPPAAPTQPTARPSQPQPQPQPPRQPSRSSPRGSPSPSPSPSPAIKPPTSSTLPSRPPPATTNGLPGAPPPRAKKTPAELEALMASMRLKNQATEEKRMVVEREQKRAEELGREDRRRVGEERERVEREKREVREKEEKRRERSRAVSFCVFFSFLCSLCAPCFLPHLLPRRCNVSTRRYHYADPPSPLPLQLQADIDRERAKNAAAKLAKIQGRDWDHSKISPSAPSIRPSELPRTRTPSPPPIESTPQTRYAPDEVWDSVEHRSDEEVRREKEVKRAGEEAARVASEAAREAREWAEREEEERRRRSEREVSERPSVVKGRGSRLAGASGEPGRSRWDD